MEKKMTRMKAVEPLHISEISPHTIQPGATFDVSESDAKSLEDRGLAERVRRKAIPAPLNKSAPKPLNK
jgi:hypothetical protein